MQLQICKFLQDKSTIDRWSDEQKVPYLVKGNTWIGYDNEKSIKIKVRLVDN